MPKVDGCSNLVPTTRGEDAPGCGRRSTHALLYTHSLNLLCTPLHLGLYPPLQPQHRDMEAGRKQVANREVCVYVLPTVSVTVKSRLKFLHML